MKARAFFARPFRVAPLSCVVLAAFGAARPSPAAYEREPVSPVGAALGGVRSVLDDPVFGNPAPLFLDRWILSASASRPFGLEDLTEARVAARGRHRRFAFGAGAWRFQAPGWSEQDFRVALGWEAGSGASVGGA
ncbi:MAG: hypothetical protein QGH59_02770, partial [Gemmatimonadota bacterium]|nr:hypothetical protein [Gemmatimonadota bacterium]